MVRRHATAERLDELGSFPARCSLSEVREARGVLPALDDGGKHRAATAPQDAREDAADLEVCILEHLLDSERVLRDISYELLARASQVSQFLDPRGWNETAADEPVREEVGDPHRVIYVRLAAWHIPDVLRIRQYQLELCALRAIVNTRIGAS